MPEIPKTLDADVPFEGLFLTPLKPSSQDEVRDIIMKSPSKFCDLDPLAAYLLKQALEHELRLTTLHHWLIGQFHTFSNLDRLLKKANFDKELLGNCRKVSNSG